MPNPPFTGTQWQGGFEPSNDGHPDTTRVQKLDQSSTAPESAWQKILNMAGLTL